MAGMGERRLMRLWQVAALAILVLGTVAITTGTWFWFQSNKDRNQIESRTTANQVAVATRKTLDGYADQIAGTGALFSQPGLLNHAQFHAYLKQLDVYSRYQGLYGLGFVARVDRAALPAFVAQARADGLPDFSVAPAGDRPSYCVASFVDANDLKAPFPLTGYDICTLPQLAATLSAAERQGTEQAVPESTFGPAAAYRGNFILVSPVYHGEPTSAADRQAQLVGWVAALVDGRQMLKVALGSTASHLGVELFTGPTAGPHDLVASSPSGLHPLAQGTQQVHFPDGGLWTVRVRTLPGAPGPANPLLAPGLVFMMAMLLNVAVAAFVWDLGRGRLRATRSFQESERRFQSMAACSPVGILEMTGDGTTKYFNPRLREIAGVDEGFLEERGWLACIHPEDRSAVAALARATWSSRQDVGTNFRILQPSGDIRHVRVLAAPVTAWEGEAPRYVASVQDVTEEVAATEALAFQAMHDHLTGLPNRALFLDRLNVELANADRSGTGLAVMFLDLDRFKVINDGLGHQAGDDLLRTVADRLLGVARSGETVARLGGDEFTFILRDIEDANAAAVVAGRILDTLAEPIEMAGREVVVTGSIGIVLPEPGSQAAALLRDADAAMYRAKEEGRARFEIFDEEQRRTVLRRLTIESELRHGIENGELRLHYQPLMSMVDGRVIGAEALVRWEHPTRGLLPPIEFIPVAEETGLIVPLGEWVFRTAAVDCARWDRAHDGPKVECLAINVSARQLASPALCPIVRQSLSVSGIDPDRINVEITESVIMSDDAVTGQSLADLRALGVMLAIDDFGTGYSSLAYLSRLPVSVVKIDKSFVDQIGIEQDGGPIVVAIVEMAHALGLQVVAEGVSRDEQRRFLAHCGCDKAQGFLWSPALAADEFAAWWREWMAGAARHSPDFAQPVPIAG